MIATNKSNLKIINLKKINYNNSNNNNNNYYYYNFFFFLLSKFYFDND